MQEAIKIPLPPLEQKMSNYSPSSRIWRISCFQSFRWLKSRPQYSSMIVSFASKTLFSCKIRLARTSRSNSLYRWISNNWRKFCSLRDSWMDRMILDTQRQPLLQHLPETLRACPSHRHRPHRPNTKRTEATFRRSWSVGWSIWHRGWTKSARSTH